jgi:hypothetical protein
LEADVETGEQGEGLMALMKAGLTQSLHIYSDPEVLNGTLEHSKNRDKNPIKG